MAGGDLDDPETTDPKILRLLAPSPSLPGISVPEPHRNSRESVAFSKLVL